MMKYAYAESSPTTQSVHTDLTQVSTDQGKGRARSF